VKFLVDAQLPPRLERAPLADKAKNGPDQGEHSEAASGIEPLYRVLQTVNSVYLDTHQAL
jgi:hypothetical protein